ncbi:aminodeoxychorismate synthase component 1 [Ruminiclostridium hungatei]|uniref:Aminodeoxychorismate synthase component 1 n=1 Tax=Ruminiclostridium hungatei TaxID=48256 RepID=A0A1V4SIR4_RUMHU|nr:chorismate-binding protein [Ruminiclostridium hungatei]OPX43365.1 aminodeoxychorismate synthase component 1 [Ruminiclostridium hungatei]
MKILLIDNYDSFTFNVYQYLRELGNHVISVRNDAITLEEIRELSPEAIFLSPGPGTPSEAGICTELIKRFAGEISIFGICLGHQAIGEAFGGKIIHAKSLFHGKTSRIFTFDKGIMSGFKDGFIATRYHSLVVERDTLPDCLEVTCETEDGQIMGIKHRDYNIEGVQFHPESIMTEKGKAMLKAYLERTGELLKNCERTKASGIDSRLDKKEKAMPVAEAREVAQSAVRLKRNGNAYELLKRIQHGFGPENSCILESVDGPAEDCGSSYIGVFPRFEIVIKDSKMTISSKNADLENMFIKNFSDMYDTQSKVFCLGAKRFSDIFPAIKGMFKTVKQHELDINISQGLIGYFSYDYFHYIEKVEKKNLDALNLPEVHLCYYSTLIHVLKESQEMVIVSNYIDDECHSDEERLLAVLQGDIAYPDEVPSGALLGITSNMKKEDFLKKVERAKKYIYEGDIFQVQIGRRLCVKRQIEPLKLYGKLRELNPSPYMFYWDAGEYQLISNSPELQLRVEDLNVKIRPIAGTSKGKGNSPEEREKKRNELVSDAKEQAEHIMLVDLARNDIGRVAEAGTVKVSKLMRAEEFSHVFHLISNVEGNISPDSNSMELFESTFPAGTLSGAPKVRALEIIEELEDEQRGPYGGAFGIFDFNGNIISSIIIRTVLRKGENLYLQASAGIVADSSPESEWNEIEHKTAAIKKALEEIDV